MSHQPGNRRTVAQWRGGRSVTVHGVDVDELWEQMQPTIAGLQRGGRLPDDAHIYDPRHEDIISALKAVRTQQADRVAQRIAAGERPGAFAIAFGRPEGNPAAAYAAYELLHRYYLAMDKPREAAAAGRAAAKALTAAEQALQRQRKKRGW